MVLFLFLLRQTESMDTNISVESSLNAEAATLVSKNKDDALVRADLIGGAQSRAPFERSYELLSD